jgi:heme-degrading monooxygenase HmoA
MKSKDRIKKIDETIKLVWDSLDSHLEWTHRKLPKRAIKDGETNKFHQKCVQEYAIIIKNLSELY